LRQRSQTLHNQSVHPGPQAGDGLPDEETQLIFGLSDDASEQGTTP